MERLRTIGVNLNRDYRNDLNANFEQIEQDINANKSLSTEMKAYFTEELARIERESIERDNANTEGHIRELLEQVEAAKNSANDAAAATIAKGNTAEQQGNTAIEKAEYAQGQGDYAKAQGDYARDKAQEADSAADTALSEAQNLGGLKTDVVNATQAANTAADNANQKANLANEKASAAAAQADYAKRQGDYAKSQADNIDDIIAGTGFIPLAQKGFAGGVAALDPDGDVIDADGNKVEGAVKSVNGQTGEITIDVPTKTSQLQNDSGFETTTGSQDKVNAHANNADVHVTASEKTQIGKIADMEQDVDTHINDTAKHLSVEQTNQISKIGDLSELTTEEKTNLVRAINELKSSGGSSTAKIYGVRIDKANSNPETAVTYTDDAVGMTGGSSAWDNIYPFNQIKPCVFKNGGVNYYLNPNDFTKKIDGTTADISSGNDGDVMIEFPKIYWKIVTNNDEVFVRYSSIQIDETWKCLAHTKENIEKTKVYIGAYLGNSISSKLRSLSGKSPTVNQTVSTFRTQAEANGAGYQQMGYYQLLLLQVLYLIRFKNLDSQTALGRGYVNGNSTGTSTGGTNEKGMNFGEITGKQQMKFSGIEDFWGNYYSRIDGLFCDLNRNILIGSQNFNDTGSGYYNFGQGATFNIDGYISDIQGTTETGFIGKAANGSETTYFSDYGTLIEGSFPIFGGNWSSASYSGAFFLAVSYKLSASAPFIASRLCYV